jgi:hypothetical protein
MATGGAQAIQGGNRRIFEAMMKESQATLRLNTEVRCVVLSRLVGAELFRIADPRYRSD